MAKIPEYSRQQSAPSQLNAPKMTAVTPQDSKTQVLSQTMDNLASAATNRSKVLQNRLTEIKQTRSDAWVSQSMADLSAQYDDYVQGEQGVYNKIGEHATGVTEAAKDELDSRIEQLAKAAPDTLAGDAFRQRALALRTSTAHNIATHESTELRKWAKTSRSANVDSQLNRITNNSQWPAERIEQEFDAFVRPDLEELATLSGVPIDAAVDEKKAEMYAGLVNRTLATDDVDRAEAQLDKWGDDMTTPVRNAMITKVGNRKASLQGQQTAETLFKDPTMTYADANSTINGITNDRERKAAREMYNSYRSAKKAADTEAYNAGVETAVTKLDSGVGDLVQQQKTYDAMPEDTEVQRKVKAKAKSRLAQYKATKGLQADTQPQAYDDAVQGIVEGRLTTKESIIGEYGDKITMADIGDLEGVLSESQKVTTTALNNAFGFALGRDGNPKVKLSTKEKADRGAYLKWAQKQVTETNRNDLDYLQNLADTWVLEGRWTADKWYQNDDLSYGEVIKREQKDQWVHPDAENYFNDESPEVRQKWYTSFNNDMDAILSAYSQQLIQREIGPRR